MLLGRTPGSSSIEAFSAMNEKGLGALSTDIEKKYNDFMAPFREEADAIIEAQKTFNQKFEESVKEVEKLRSMELLTEPQKNARIAELRAEFEKNEPTMALAVSLADKYTDSLMALDRQLDAVIDTASRVPGKVTPGVVSEAGASLGKEAWSVIQGENLYKSTDAARQYRFELEALEREKGRMSDPLYEAAKAAGESQYNDARSAGMFAAIEGALNALEQKRIDSTTEALENLAQVRMDSLAAELQSVADAFAELQSFAQGEYFATRNPFEEYAAHMEQLNMADMYGMIDADTYMRSAMAAAGDMDRALGLDKMPQMGSPFIAPPSAPGPAGFSTASQIAGVLAGAIGPKDIAKQQLTEAQKTNMLLERSLYNGGGIFL
jgi:hypothetical protein